MRICQLAALYSALIVLPTLGAQVGAPGPGPAGRSAVAAETLEDDPDGPATTLWFNNADFVLLDGNWFDDSAAKTLSVYHEFRVVNCNDRVLKFLTALPGEVRVSLESFADVTSVAMEAMLSRLEPVQLIVDCAWPESMVSSLARVDGARLHFSVRQFFVSAYAIESVLPLAGRFGSVRSLSCSEDLWSSHEVRSWQYSEVLDLAKSMPKIREFCWFASQPQATQDFVSRILEELPELEVVWIRTPDTLPPTVLKAVLSHRCLRHLRGMSSTFAWDGFCPAELAGEMSPLARKSKLEVLDVGTTDQRGQELWVGLLPLLPNLRNLNAYGWSASRLLPMISRLTLSALSWTNGRIDMEPDGKQSGLSEQFRSDLRWIDLEDTPVPLEWFLQLVPDSGLEILSYQHDAAWPHDCLKNIDFSSLRGVAVAGTAPHTPWDFGMLRAASGLKWLRFWQCSLDLSRVHEMPWIKTIQCIDISAYRAAVVGIGSFGDVDSWPALHRLHLPHCSMPGEALAALLGKVPELRHLYAHRLTLTGENARWPAPLQLKKLQSLHVTGCSWIADDMQKIVQACPLLVRLSFSGDESPPWLQEVRRGKPWLN